MIEYKKELFIRNDYKISKITKDGFFEIETSVFNTDFQKANCNLIDLTENFKIVATGSLETLENILEEYYKSPIYKVKTIYQLEKIINKKVKQIYTITESTLQFLNSVCKREEGLFEINGELYSIKQ